MPIWATKERKTYWPLFVQPIKLRSSGTDLSRGKLGEPLPVNGVRDPENTSSLVSPQVRLPRVLAEMRLKSEAVACPSERRPAVASLPVDDRRSPTRKFAQLVGALK